MAINIYTPDGWLNIPLIVQLAKHNNCFMCLMTGARGIGKTYGFFDYVEDEKQDFIYMRRTARETDFLRSTPQVWPQLQNNLDHGRDITLESVDAYVSQFKDGDTVRGMMFPLSTVSQMRGFSAPSVTIIGYDEFIPEPHARPIKEEGMAFFNAYETVNRNRELKGFDPVFVLGMSNSNRIDNALYMDLGLVPKVDAMIRKGQEVSFLPDRGIMLVNILHSPISAKKSKTALYRATKGTRFSEMALENKYIGESDRVNIGQQPIEEYRPIVAVGNICIYAHKSQNRYYVTTHASGTPETFGGGANELMRFRRSYGWLWSEYMARSVWMESPICDILFNKYFSTR